MLIWSKKIMKKILSKEKQPILPFAKKKEVKCNENIFKLPTINFLKKILI